MLTRSERLFLQEHIRWPAAFLEQLNTGANHQLEVWLTLDEADEVISQLQELVQREGYDGVYELTDTGRTAEALIDKLFPD